MSAKLNSVLLVSLLTAATATQAAIALDRTRVVFPGTGKSVVMNISNENPKKPYLAQAWMEDVNGQKISSPFVVVPPMQRVEPQAKSVIRVNSTPAVASLPQDRESVFWFNVREIPPKSDHANVMQVALQTRIKLFYRPVAIVPDKYSRWDNQLILHRAAGGYQVENPTPYFMTIIAVTGAEKESVAKDFQPIMIAPKSSALVKSKQFAKPFLTTINDFGGRPVLGFQCAGNDCHADPVEHSL